MSEKLKTVYDIIEVKTLTNFIRVIYSCIKDSSSWNLSLPFRVDKKGIIKENSYNKVLDDIRNSYGIDLTSDIELEEGTLNKEKKHIKEKIKILKENIKKNPKDSNSKVLLSKYDKKLSRIVNNNTTYNNYCLRKKKFDFTKLNKLVASFLLVTGQVVYNKDSKKFVFVIDKNSSLYTVNDFNSFNIPEKFNQKIFEKTYYIKAEHSNFIKKAGMALTDFIQKTDNVFETSSIKFNEKYKTYIIAKINKIYPLVKKSDARNILRSLYEFRVNLVNKKLIEEKENEVKNFKSFSSLLEDSLGKKVDKVGKKTLVGSLSKCLPKSSINKKEAFNFINNLLYFLDSRYILREEIEKDYFKKSDIEKDYVKKSEVERDYIKKSDIEKDYIKKSDIEKDYIKKSEVERDYIKKSEVERDYVKKSEIEKNYVSIDKFNSLQEELNRVKKLIEENKIIRKQLLKFRNMFK